MEDQTQLLRKRVETALEAEGSKAHTFCVTSGKGGVGKTSFSVNFALALANRGKKAVILDGDFGFSNVNIMLGKNAKYSLEHVVCGQKKLSEVMEESYPGVWYISGGSGVAELLRLRGGQMEEMIQQLGELEQQMDYIIFDTGAGINGNILRMIEASDQTILITTPEPTSILDGYVVIKTASGLADRPDMSVVINKAASEREANVTYHSLADVARKHLGYELSMLGFIPADKRITQSINSMEPYLRQYPSSLTAMQIQRIADHVTKLQPVKRERGIYSFFRRLAKR